MTEVGSVLDGKYVILKEIGRGGTSTVYLAVDNRLGKKWAIKKMKVEDAKEGYQIKLKSALKKEAFLLTKLDHPTFVTVVDFITQRDYLYVVMEYVKGQTLLKWLATHTVTKQQLFCWCSQLLDGLMYLHKMTPPIIYRDLKPENIMVKEDGTLKVIDFGAAKEKKSLRPDSLALGTKGFAAPEQFGDSNGKGLFCSDERTDIYGFGALLSYITKQQSIKGFQKIIKKSMKTNPKERYQSVLEVKKEIEKIRIQEGKEKKKQRQREIVLALGLFFLVLCTTVGVRGYAKEKNYSDLVHSIHKEALELASFEQEAPRQELRKLYSKLLREGLLEQEEMCKQVAYEAFFLKDYELSYECFKQLKHWEAISEKDTLFWQMNQIIKNRPRYSQCKQWLDKFSSKIEQNSTGQEKLSYYLLLIKQYGSCTKEPLLTSKEKEEIHNKIISYSETVLLLLAEYEKNSYQEEKYKVYQYLVDSYEELYSLNKVDKNTAYSRMISYVNEMVTLIKPEEALESKVGKFQLVGKFYMKLGELKKANAQFYACEQLCKEENNLSLLLECYCNQLYLLLNEKGQEEEIRSIYEKGEALHKTVENGQWEAVRVRVIQYLRFQDSL